LLRMLSATTPASEEIAPLLTMMTNVLQINGKVPSKPAKASAACPSARPSGSVSKLSMTIKPDQMRITHDLVLLARSASSRARNGIALCFHPENAGKAMRSFLF